MRASSVSVAALLFGAVMRAADQEQGTITKLSDHALSKVLDARGPLDVSDQMNARLVCKRWMSQINQHFCAQILGKEALNDEVKELAERGQIEFNDVGNMLDHIEIAKSNGVYFTPLWHGKPVSLMQFRFPKPSPIPDRIRMKQHWIVDQYAMDRVQRLMHNSQPSVDGWIPVIMHRDRSAMLNLHTSELIELPVIGAAKTLKKHEIAHCNEKFLFDLHTCEDNNPRDLVAVRAKENFLNYFKCDSSKDKVVQMNLLTDGFRNFQNFLSDDHSTLLACEKFKIESCMIANVVDTRDHSHSLNFLIASVTEFNTDVEATKDWALITVQRWSQRDSSVHLCNLRTGYRTELNEFETRNVKWMSESLFLVKALDRELGHSVYHIRSVLDPHTDLAKFSSIHIDGNELQFRLDGDLDETIMPVARNLLATQNGFVEIETFNSMMETDTITPVMQIEKPTPVMDIVEKEEEEPEPMKEEASEPTIDAISAHKRRRCAEGWVKSAQQKT